MTRTHDCHNASRKSYIHLRSICVWVINPREVCRTWLSVWGSSSWDGVNRIRPLPWRMAECESWWSAHDCPLEDSHRILKINCVKVSYIVSLKYLQKSADNVFILVCCQKTRLFGLFWGQTTFWSINLFSLLMNKEKLRKIITVRVLQHVKAPLTLLAAAARTSASQSFRRFWKAGTRSFLVISGPTAFWSWIQRDNRSQQPNGAHHMRI